MPEDNETTGFNFGKAIGIGLIVAGLVQLIPSGIALANNLALQRRFDAENEFVGIRDTTNGKLYTREQYQAYMLKFKTCYRNRQTKQEHCAAG